MRGIFGKISVFLVLGLALAGSARGAQRSFGINAVAGVPQLLGGELRYIVGYEGIELGLGFGMLPVNGILNDSVDLQRRQVDLNIPGKTFYIVPHAVYSMYATSGFARFYPGRGAFFTQLGFTNWTFKADMTGDLENETDGTTKNGALSGTAKVNQWLIGAVFGYQIRAADGLYIDIGGGANVNLRPSSDLTVTGTPEDVGVVDPGAEQNFNNEVAQIQAQMDAAVESYGRSLKFSPVLFIAMGWAF